MKIKTTDSLLVDTGDRNFCFVKIMTDEGITGIGEAYSAGPDKATAEVIAYFGDWIRGLNPLDIEDIWQRLYQGSRFPGGSVVYSAMSGIDQALWDIKGKALDVPVYQLLGGKCRNKIRIYINPGGSSLERIAENALSMKDKYGLSAIKTEPFPPGFQEIPWPAVLKKVEKKMAYLRKRLGDEFDIGLDAHAKLIEPSKAVQVCEVVSPYKPMFVEEPVRPENRKAMAFVRSKTNVPIATGEMLYTKWEFQDLIRHGGADIIQPDICCCGGLTEMKKIAALAEAAYLVVAPHNPMSPVATAVNVQFAATTPNFFILEYRLDDRSPRCDLVENPLEIRDGYLCFPERPGIGIELNEDYCLKHPYKAWKRPFPFHPDGAMGLI